MQIDETKKIISFPWSLWQRFVGMTRQRLFIFVSSRKENKKTANISPGYHFWCIVRKSGTRTYYKFASQFPPQTIWFSDPLAAGIEDENWIWRKNNQYVWFVQLMLPYRLPTKWIGNATYIYMYLYSCICLPTLVIFSMPTTKSPWEKISLSTKRTPRNRSFC